MVFKTEELKIGTLAFGGDGLARYPEGHVDAGKVVFVRGGLSGETVLAEVGKRGKDFDRATVIEILEPSPDRIEPGCDLFGRCGGCQLRHLSHPGQLRAKEGWFREALLRAGVEETALRPIRPSPQAEGYRYRARLRLARSGQLGFLAASSNRVVEVHRCPNLTDPLNDLLAACRAALAGFRPRAELELEIGALNGAAYISVKPLLKGRLPRPVRDSARKAVGLLKTTGAGVHLGRPKPGPGEVPKGTLVIRQIKGLELLLFPTVFGQAQEEMNRELTGQVVDLALDHGQNRILDLMAGMGNLSLPLARAGARARAVEVDPLACLNGRVNSGRSGCNVGFGAQTAEAYLSVRGACSDIDTIILDPPRSGVRGMIEPLAGSMVGRIVYVSCQPSALARDLASLGNLGYRLEVGVPLDLFPQTFHLESVCRLGFDG